MKRTLASILACLLLLSILSPAALCAEQQDDTPAINSTLLDAMLYGDRHWVIETLVQDSRTNNPLTILQGAGGQKSLARKALDTYEGINAESDTYAAIYKSLVDIMEKLYNKDEYISGLADEAGTLIGAAAELFTGIDGLKDTISDVTTSTDEIRYDRLLKAALTAEFTASSGVTVGKDESDLIYARQAQDIVNYFGSFIALVNTNVDTLVGMSDAKAFTQEYITSYAVPYRNAALEYLSSIDTLCKASGGGLGHADKMKPVSALASLEAYSILKPEPTFSGFSYKDCLGEFMVDSGVKATFSLLNKIFTIQETALDSYLYVNSLQRQRETIIGPLQRLSASTTDEAMGSSVSYTVSMLDESYICNSKKANVPVRKEAGSLELANYLIGDIYSDNEVNMKDIVYFARWFNKQETMSDQQKKAADVFYDHQLDVKDLTALAQLLSRAITTDPISKMSAVRTYSAAPEIFCLSVSDAAVNQNGEATLTIQGRNCPGVAALRFKLELPADCEIVSVEPSELLKDGTFGYNKESRIVTWYAREDHMLNGKLLTMHIRARGTCPAEAEARIVYQKNDYFHADAYETVPVTAESGKIWNGTGFAVTNAQRDGNAIRLTVKAAASRKVRIIVADYAADGKFLRMTVHEQTIAAGDNSTCIVPTQPAAGAYSAVFCLDAGRNVPLCGKMKLNT